jgi:hypothetical protein
MIQFNLLPDIKLEYIRARRTKHLIVLISGAAAALAVTVLIALILVVNVFQRNHFNDLNRDAESLTSKLKGTKDLSKVLTIQNQLKTLPSLHDSKPVVSRLFPYLVKITPAKVSIAKIDVSFIDDTMTITGGADSIASVNTYVDTLKFTNYTQDGLTDLKKAFSLVVLGNSGFDDKSISYQVSFKFDPTIFNATSDVQLVVPQQITTLSETEKPTDLPQQNSNTKAP